MTKSFYGLSLTDFSLFYVCPLLRAREELTSGDFLGEEPSSK